MAPELASPITEPERKFCYLWLTCSKGEERQIAQRLLAKHLISCAKFVAVSSMYWWQHEIESADEIAIIMESAEDLFDEIEAEVATIHSYDTFVLQLLPVARINRSAAKWMNESLKAPSRR